MANTRFFSKECLTYYIAVAFMLLPILGSAQENADSAKLSVNGFGSHETGQLVAGRWKGTDIYHQWLMRENVNISVNYLYNEYFRLCVGITGRVWYETFPDEARNPFTSPRKQFYTVYPSNAEGIFSYNKWDACKVSLEAGYFPFQYNPDVRNLGEYLFRCGTYPPYIVTNFDMTASRLAGLHLSGSFMDVGHLHLLLTQECEMPSFYDPSFSALADANYKKIITIGGGIMYNRFWPVDSKATSLQTNQLNMYIDPVDSSTKFYTFQGTKVMARFSIDSKPLIPLQIFGENDLKLYGEVAWLGLKDYPLYYEDLNKRMPVMLGFDVPCFKILDIAALEVEYYAWNYSNGYQNPVQWGLASPALAQGQYTQADYLKDNLKWSVYVKKNFFKHSYVLLQFANDHLVLPAYDENQYDREEVCGRPKSWYWMFKFGVNF